jgi:hypothetical protein
MKAVLSTRAESRETGMKVMRAVVAEKALRESPLRRRLSRVHSTLLYRPPVARRLSVDSGIPHAQGKTKLPPLRVSKRWSCSNEV